MTLLLLRREQHLNRTLHNLVMDSTNKDEALQVSAQRECAVSACLIDFFRFSTTQPGLMLNWKIQLGQLSRLALPNS